MSRGVDTRPESLETLPKIDDFFEMHSNTIIDRPEIPATILGPSRQQTLEMIKTFFPNGNFGNPTVEPKDLDPIHTLSTQPNLKTVGEINSYVAFDEQRFMPVRTHIIINPGITAQEVISRLIKDPSSVDHRSDDYWLSFISRPKVEKPTYIYMLFTNKDKKIRRVMMYIDPEDPQKLDVNNGNLDEENSPYRKTSLSAPKPLTPEEVEEEIIDHTTMIVLLAEVIDHKINPRDRNPSRPIYCIGEDPSSEILDKINILGRYSRRIAAQRDYDAEYLKYYDPTDQDEGNEANSQATTEVDPDKSITSYFDEIKHALPDLQNAPYQQGKAPSALDQLKDLYADKGIKDDSLAVQSIIDELDVHGYGAHSPKEIPSTESGIDPSKFTLEMIRSALDPKIYEVLISIVNARNAGRAERIISGALGSAPKRTLLMHGEPGSGKSFAVQAFVNSLEAEFIEITADDLNNRYVGTSESVINEKLANIRQPNKQKPVVIMIDEIEKLLNYSGSTGDSGGAGRSYNALFAKILKLLDEIQENKDGLFNDVYFLMSGNNVGDMHESMRRAGRVGYNLYFKKPDGKVTKDFFFDLVSKNSADHSAYIPGFRAYALDLDISGLSREMSDKEFSIADIHRISEVCLEVMNARTLEQFRKRSRMLARQLGRKELLAEEEDMILATLRPKPLSTDDVMEIIYQHYEDMQNARN